MLLYELLSRNAKRLKIHLSSGHNEEARFLASSLFGVDQVTIQDVQVEKDF